jgi:hypothetical protein
LPKIGAVIFHRSMVRLPFSAGAKAVEDEPDGDDDHRQDDPPPMLQKRSMPMRCASSAATECSGPWNSFMKLGSITS